MGNVYPVSMKGKFCKPSEVIKEPDGSTILVWYYEDGSQTVQCGWRVR